MDRYLESDTCITELHLHYKIAHKELMTLLQNYLFTCAHFGLYMRLKSAGNVVAGKGFTCALKNACIEHLIHVLVL